MSIGIRCDTVTVIVPVTATATATVTVTVADTDSGFSTEIKVAWTALAKEILQYLTCTHSFFSIISSFEVKKPVMTFCQSLHGM